jgi:hypothetical protein
METLMSIMHLAIALCFASSTSAFAQSAQYTAMTGEQFKQALSKGPAVALTPNRSTGTISYSPDGSASFSIGGNSDTGRWRPTDSGYCVTWNRTRTGTEGCFDSFLIPDGTIEIYNAGTNSYAGKLTPQK